MSDSTLALLIVSVFAVAGIGGGLLLFQLLFQLLFAPLYACPHCRAPQRVYLSAADRTCGGCGERR